MLYTNLFSGSGGGFSDDGGQSVYFSYPTGFTPAPFTFAIWLPIFAGTVALAIYQALPGQKLNQILDRICGPYSLALCANAATPYTDLGLSNWAVLVLAVSLAKAFSMTLPLTPNRQFRFFVQATLAIFGTWAGLAAILNGCQWLVSQGVAVGTPEAAILVVLAMAAGIAAIIRTKEPIIAAVMVWAGIGIAAAQSGSTLLVLIIFATSIATIAASIGVRRSF
jgi:hypothetical protein